MPMNKSAAISTVVGNGMCVLYTFKYEYGIRITAMGMQISQQRG